MALFRRACPARLTLLILCIVSLSTLCHAQPDPNKVGVNILFPANGQVFPAYEDFERPTIGFSIMLAATHSPLPVNSAIELVLNGVVAGRVGATPASFAVGTLPVGAHTARAYLVDDSGQTFGFGDEITIYFEDHTDPAELEPLASTQQPCDANADTATPQCRYAGLGLSDGPLVNAAMDKSASQSSTLEDQEARLAIDGETTPLQQGAVTVSATLPEADAWWEVDLEMERSLHTIDIHASRLLQPPTEYPELKRDSPLDGAVVTLLDFERKTVGSMELSGDVAMYSWPRVDTLARYVRIEWGARARENGGTARSLRLAEVRVWAAALGGWSCEDTCEHGVCVQGVCVCDLDYTGPDCTTSLLSEWRYLPPMDVRAFAEDPRGPASALYKEALADIDQVQNPASCSAATADLYFYPNAGMASTLNYIAGLLSLSFTRGRAMALSHRVQWCYTDHDSCPTRDLACYFTPWSNCTDLTDPPPSDAVGIAGVSVSSMDPTSVPYDFDQHFYRRPIEYQPMGVFWWRAMILETLFRLNPKTEDALQLEDIKQRLGFGGPMVGLHVRLGDSNHTSWRKGKAIGMSEHIREMLDVTERYGIRKVFVATDDMAAAEELPRVGRENNLTIIMFNDYDRGDISGGTDWIEKRLERQELNGSPLAHFTLIDMLLLAETDILIGHFQSNLSRMAYTLAAIKRRRPPPYVSIDGPWCYQWRMCCNMRPGGGSDIC